MSNSSGLSGLTFAFAGRFSKKQVVEKLIKSNGGTTSSTVSGKVTHLVISENSSTNTEASEKYIKAKKNNIPIIKESEFFDLCRQKGINVNEGSSAPSSSTQEPKQSPYFSSTTTTPQTPEKESSKSPKSDQKTSTTTTNSLNSLNSNNDDFNVVIIGKTATPREDLKSLVETSGGTLIDSICPEANFLVCSEKEHPDLLKAVEYNIKIINEGQLIRVCDYQANLRMTNKKSAHKTSPTKPKETKPENTNNTENPKNDDSNESSKTDNSNDTSNLNENHSSSNVEITSNQDSEISSNGKERSPKSEEGRLTKRAKVLLEGDVGSEWQCTFYGNDSNTSNENNTSNEVV